MATRVSGANDWLTINGKPLNFQPDNENEALNIVEYSHYTIQITTQAPDHLTLIIDDEEIDTARYGIWTWNPQHYAGLYRLIVQAPNDTPHTATIRVFPQKLTQPLYEKMKSDLSRIAFDLQFCLDSPAHERAIYAPPSSDESSSLREYHKIHRLLEEMRDIMLRLRREPHYALHQEQIELDWQDIVDFSDDLEPLPGASVKLPPELARRHGFTHLPQHWIGSQSSLTYDVYENRLLKQFLQKQLVAKLEIIERRAANEKKRVEQIYARYHNDEDGKMIRKLQQVIIDCQQMKQRCVRWSSEPFLTNVSSVALMDKPTQLLLKHPTYSRFYRLYVQFQQQLTVTRETECYVNELAMRRVSALYEMWSVFFITRLVIDELLKEGYHIVSRSLFYEVEKNYFQFDVQRNIASIVLERDDVRVEFKYEPIYPNQSTVFHRSAVVATTIGTYPLTPDMAIEVYRHGEPQHILIFDAKYKRAREADGNFYPKIEDITAMYRYQRNIQYKNYQPGKGRNPYTIEDIVTSAYILYPGNKIHSEAKNTIGGLPLIPNMSNKRIDEIREQLKDLLYYAYLID